MQYNKIEFLIINWIEKLYSNLNHIEISLGISNRTLGLSTNPGEHGLVILVYITIISVLLLKEKKFKKFNFIIILSGIFSILTSQSQTAFIGLIILNILLFVYYLFKSKNSKNYRIYFLIILIFATFITYSFIDELRYLVSLFEYGLERSSYVKREIKAEYIFNMAMSEPIGLVIGWGKSFFGGYSTAMDNEHLYMFLVYGLFPYLLFLIYLLKLICKSIKSNNTYIQIFILLMILGIPMSYPNSYYLTPKILLILTIFYINYTKENHETTITIRP
jgi:hypothetical protein